MRPQPAPLFDIFRLSRSEIPVFYDVFDGYMDRHGPIQANMYVKTAVAIWGHSQVVNGYIDRITSSLSSLHMSSLSPSHALPLALLLGFISSKALKSRKLHV